VDETLSITTEKHTVAVRSASDIEPAMSLFTVESDKGLAAQAEKIGNFPDFLRPKNNAAFTIAALSAFLAFKSFHE
jgi:hypothetical protein